MKKILFILFTLLVVGCSSTNAINTNQRAQMRTRIFEANYNLAFKATMRVLEVQEYSLVNADSKTGLIVGDKSYGKSVFSNPKRDEINCNLTELNSEISEIRLNLRTITSKNTAWEKAEVNDDALTYDLFFKEIRLEIERLKAYQR